MLIKFFARGTGSGNGPVEYATRADLEGREAHTPEILRGDANRTRDLIDSIDREWRYTSGVVSFALEDAPSEAQQQEVMDEFEQVAFAGLESDQYDILWVRHQHTEGGRVELHFVTPRIELTTGKALNIAPPGWEAYYGPLRDALNAEHGWARPDDPDRARDLQKGPQRAVERLHGRDAIQGYLTAQIASGAVYDRNSMVLALQDAGLQISRQGKDYVTAVDPQNGSRFRLKGTIYEQGWTREQHIDRAIGREAGSGPETGRGTDPERAQEARAELSRRVESRARHHQERYPRAERDHGEDLARDAALAALDRSGLSHDRDSVLGASLGRDMVDEDRPGAIAQRGPERAPGTGRSDRPDPWHPVHGFGQGNVSGAAVERGRDDAIQVRRPDLYPDRGVREDGSVISPGARVDALRDRLGRWFEQGTRRAASFLEGLRRERDEQHRGTIERDRGRAADAASAFERSGAAERRGMEQVNGHLGGLHRALEGFRGAVDRLRGQHEVVERCAEQVREVTRQQERNYQRDRGFER